MFTKVWVLASLCASLCASHAVAQAQSITLASTTSTEQSGLFAHLLPAFKKASGIDVKVVALGTGQALDMARRGDADVVLVHDRLSEDRFVAEGFGLARRAVMYNDFVVVGPGDDPAKVAGRDLVAAFKRLALTQASFVSRGDKSGTHAAEMRTWAAAGLTGHGLAPKGSPDAGAGYRACGCGMGQALNMAAASGAYTLSDRGTWLSFKNKAGLAVLVQGDPLLFNPYGVIGVNPAKHPHVKAADAAKFIDWLTSAQGQSQIASYRIDGEPLFFPRTTD